MTKVTGTSRISDNGASFASRIFIKSVTNQTITPLLLKPSVRFIKNFEIARSFICDFYFLVETDLNKPFFTLFAIKSRKNLGVALILKQE